MRAAPTDRIGTNVAPIPSEIETKLSNLIGGGDFGAAAEEFVSRIWPSRLAPERKIQLLKELIRVAPAAAAATLLERLYERADIGESWEQQNAELPFRRANAEYRAGFLEQSLLTIDAITFNMGSSPLVESLRSDVLAALGRQLEAVAAAEQAWKSKPERADYVLLLAQRLVEVDRGDDAFVVLQRALERNPFDERLVAGIAGLSLPLRRVRELHQIAAESRRLRTEADDERSSGHEETDGDVLAQVRKHVSEWEGFRHKPESLIVGLNETGSKPPLFWCFQSYNEFELLSRALGPDRPLFGMRSSHLIVGYRHEKMHAMATSYAREIAEIQPDGALQIGGNCQGAIVAQISTMYLCAQGRDIAVLLLMEEPKFLRFVGRVALLFGRESSMNPYAYHPDPEAMLKEAFPNGYSFDLIDGEHGKFFTEQNVGSLANVIDKHLLQ